MTNEDKAYLAGIIDGEGSIMLIRIHYNKHPSPCVSIASISLELLEWVKSKTNCGTIKEKKNYKPGIHKTSYTYLARYNDAMKIIGMIEPYLVIKQKKLRAQLILSEYKRLTPRNGRYSPDLLEAKNDFYERFMSL